MLHEARSDRPVRLQTQPAASSNCRPCCGSLPAPRSRPAKLANAPAVPAPHANLRDAPMFRCLTRPAPLRAASALAQKFAQSARAWPAASNRPQPTRSPHTAPRRACAGGYLGCREGVQFADQAERPEAAPCGAGWMCPPHCPAAPLTTKQNAAKPRHRAGLPAPSRRPDQTPATAASAHP